MHIDRVLRGELAWGPTPLCSGLDLASLVSGLSFPVLYSVVLTLAQVREGTSDTAHLVAACLLAAHTPIHATRTRHRVNYNASTPKERRAERANCLPFTLSLTAGAIGHEQA